MAEIKALFRVAPSSKETNLTNHSQNKQLFVLESFHFLSTYQESYSIKHNFINFLMAISWAASDSVYLHLNQYKGNKSVKYSEYGEKNDLRCSRHR